MSDVCRRWAPAVAFSAVLLGGCASPLVGGECLPGLTVCDGRCISLEYDDLNCGACGSVCDDGSTCIQGTCTAYGDAGTRDAGAPEVDGGDAGAGDAGTHDGGADDDGGGGDAGIGDGGADDDGGSGDAGTGDGGTSDAGTGDGGTSDGGTSDGGTTPSCDLGELYCDGACIDPDSNAAHCGECGASCDEGELCSGGGCVAVCEEPRTECGGACVDTSSHADHCGACDVRCDSGFCFDGECGDGLVGRVVVIGHDYEESRVGMNRLAGNAVFLASGAPVRVLVYEGASRPASVAGVDQAIDQVAEDTGRTWERTAVAADRVPLELARADAFVVYSQHGATDGGLRDLGAAWATALHTFLRRGGVVVLFDGGGDHEGTWQVLDASGLFVVSGRVDVSGDRIDVVSPGDAVALNVPRTYRAEAHSVRFMTTEETVVTEHAEGAVVIHRVVLP
jgi:hypothetical protein